MRPVSRLPTPSSGALRFDVILIGDLRVPGGTSRQLANEIRALHGAGYRVGLINVELPHARGHKPIDALIGARLAAGEALLLRNRLDELEAGLVIFENPRAFVTAPTTAIRIRADRAVIALHFPAVDGRGVATFDPDQVIRVCATITDAPLVWVATSRLTADILRKARSDLPLLDTVIPCIVHAEEFATPRRALLKSRPVIGRHSRPQSDKWPATRKALLEVYPASADVEVALMGVDDAWRTRVGRIPGNWRTHEFNEIGPADFLAGIDFFVYFHHPDWIEAFGIATAEAMASGAVAILPEYMRANFGAAALYREPAQVQATVRSLHRDQPAFLKQSRKGIAYVRKHHSPDAYLAAIGPLLPKRRAAAKAARFDVINLADLRRPGNEAQRVANEAQAQADAGLQVAFLHAPGRAKGGRIRPEIDALVRSGRVAVVDPLPGAKTRLLIAHGPSAYLSQHAAGIHAEQAVIVVTAPVASTELVLCERLLRNQLGNRFAWAPVNDSLRAQLAEAGAGATIDHANWLPVVGERAAGSARSRRREAVAVVLNPGQGAEALKKLTAALPRNGTLTVRVHGAPSDKVIQQLPPLTGWQTFKAFEMALGKVLDGADILYCADAGNDVAVAEAMARGMPIVAAPSLRRYFGDAAVYSSAAETASAIAKLRKSPRHFAQYAARSRDRATRCHGQADYVRGLCERMKTAAPRAIAPSNPRRRLMMFAQNGVGLGHVVRQLAIARELSADHDIVFCSMSQAYDLISRYGYQVEYLPSHVYTGVEYTEWHGWARAQIEQMIDFHDVGVVVLDGSVPYAGLIEAVAPRPDVRLAWLRRPMWRPGKESSVRIAQQKFFDLVIEPEELAAALDTGPTVAQRERALCVAPIRLLERRELLSREKAAAALGLDPARPAMLIQLGSGTNRDVVSLIDRIVVAARPYSGLQLVLAEWRNANDRLDLWPNVICLRGFPYSRYFNAFDFSFSAAGYNSFHEIFAYRLPTAFLVNPRDYMDGQNLRAEFAAAQGAAIACDGGLAQIASALSRLMSADVRATMRTAMASLARPNGAKTAARAIANLLESMP